MLDVWNQRCSAALFGLLQAAREAPQNPGRLARLLRVPDPAITAGLALVIVAPRIAELAEALLPQGQAWLSTDAHATLIPMSFACGASLFDAILEAPRRDWNTLLGWLAGADLPACAQGQHGRAVLDTPTAASRHPDAVG